jgi:hypothetical protein
LTRLKDRETAVALQKEDHQSREVVRRRRVNERRRCGRLSKEEVSRRDKSDEKEKRRTSDLVVLPFDDEVLVAGGVVELVFSGFVEELRR